MLLLLKSFFNWLKDINHQRWLLLIILVIAVLLGVKECQKSSILKNQMEQNSYALQDTVHIMYNKLNEIYSSKAITISKLEQLEYINKELYDEVKKLKGTVVEISKIGVKVIYVDKPITSTIIKYPDGSFGINWSDTVKGYSDFYREIVGVSQFRIDSNKLIPENIQTTLLKDYTEIKLITGIWKNNMTNKWEVFARNSNPNIKFVLDGNVIQDKIEELSSSYSPKKWHFGFYSGIGLSGPFDKNWANVSVSYHLGIGLQYSLFSF